VRNGLCRAAKQVGLYSVMALILGSLTSCSSVSPEVSDLLDQALSVVESLTMEPEAAETPQPASPATSDAGSPSGGTTASALPPATASGSTSQPAAQSTPQASSKPAKTTASKGASRPSAQKPPQAASKPAKTTATKAVHVILQNNASSSVNVELIDQYGGNFTASIDAGMSQNQTLRNGSEIKVNGSAVHVISANDKGKTVVVAQ
jgi:hypothetical protein